MATLIVPRIARPPTLVSSPVMSNQLPPISEKAATYDMKIGKGMCRGRTKASAKFSMLANFS